MSLNNNYYMYFLTPHAFLYTFGPYAIHGRHDVFSLLHTPLVHASFPRLLATPFMPRLSAPWPNRYLNHHIPVFGGVALFLHTTKVCRNNFYWLCRSISYISVVTFPTLYVATTTPPRYGINLSHRKPAWKISVSFLEIWLFFCSFPILFPFFAASWVMCVSCGKSFETKKSKINPVRTGLVIWF